MSETKDSLFLTCLTINEIIGVRKMKSMRLRSRQTISFYFTILLETLTVIQYQILFQ